MTIIGWFIVARQTERRELRKEVRERVADLSEACSLVEAAALAYWVESTVAKAPAAAVSLAAAIKRLSRHALSLQAAGLSFDQPALISEIRKAATSGDFDKKDRRHTSDDSAVVADTVGALEELLLAVNDAFYITFQPQRSYNWWKLGVLLLLLVLISS